MERDIFVIMNPAARNGLSRKTWLKVAHQLHGISYILKETQYKGHAAILAKEIGQSTDRPILLIAVGGDGTIHETANGVFGMPHVTVGFIPAGSGNDFAKGFKLPEDPSLAAEMIRKYAGMAGTLFSCGRFEAKDSEAGIFVNSLGAGFDAVISEKANASNLKKWLNYLSLGKLIYVYYLLAELFFYRPMKAELCIDGKSMEFDDVWFITIANQPFYGGGMRIAPFADPQEVTLEIVVAHRLSRVKLLFVFVAVFWGGHIRFKEVAQLTGSDVTVTFEQPVPFHADGEPSGVTPLSIGAIPNSWRVLQK